VKLKVIKNYDGNIEFIYGNKTVYLTEENPSIILTEKEYGSIPEHKQYLITNEFVIVEFVEEEIKETKDNNKKFTKK